MEERRERKPRARRKGFAFVISDYCSVDEYGFPPYKQIARSLGVDRDYDHPNIEALINFSPELGSHTVISYVLNKIAEVARLAPGDRITYSAPETSYQEYTIEFRESEDEYGPCLRAVLLGIMSEYQPLPSHEAHADICASPYRVDPLADYE